MNGLIDPLPRVFALWIHWRIEIGGAFLFDRIFPLKMLTLIRTTMPLFHQFKDFYAVLIRDWPIQLGAYAFYAIFVKYGTPSRITVISDCYFGSK
jgi:hypothetical protein